MRRALQVEFRVIQHGVTVDEGCIDREVVEIGLQEGGDGEPQEWRKVRKRCRRKNEKAGRGDQCPY